MITFKMLLPFLFVLLEVLTIVLLLQAQDQSGFISIDCGLPAEDPGYTEHSTGIRYISDAKFIDTGEIKRLSASEQRTVLRQLRYVRSFPRGVRNCYRINVTSGTKYLIRTTFYYGNYDDRNEAPEFDLHLGANLWSQVNFPNASLMRYHEIIHSPSQDYIRICLVNTGYGTPFISTIELRNLTNDIYNAQSSSLSLFRRYDLGSLRDMIDVYRYKDDVYDRMWHPYDGFDQQQWTQLNTPLSNFDSTQDPYKPPAIVMRTAATPINANASLDFIWNSDDVNTQYYVYVHFNEIQRLAPNETRAFNYSCNGKYLYGPVILKYQRTFTTYSRSPLTGAIKYRYSFFKTETSTLPPIVNAIEVYQTIDFSQPETELDDDNAITNIKKTYGVDRNWQGDPCAPKAYMWEGLNCSFDGDNSPRITYLNLSSSGLTGHIASYISKLTMLQYLDLSNNSLSGLVPDFLTQLQSLKVLNLGDNLLTGVVPSELVDRSKKGSLSLSVEQNPNLCISASCNQSNQQADDQNKKKKNNVVIPVVASVAGISVFLVIASLAIIHSLKKRKPRGVDIHVEPNTSRGLQVESKQRQYSLNDLVQITNNFVKILGRGGFGTVYHGFIEDIQVAVKMLSPSSVQGYQQFVAEVKLLMRVHHRNLTTLVGYCNEESSVGLIYEYMGNGNLAEHLSGKNSMAKLLTWEDRLRIAVDAAQGLEYLHNGCKPPIVHRDVKCTNILLNENFQAKLADFGLSKSFPADGGTHMSTVVAGTPGYLDPEYNISNRLTEKSDVYGFGVVVLNIITGQPAITKRHDHISRWVSSKLSNGDIKSIVDSKLKADFDTSSAWKAVEIAMDCVSISSAKRPNMSVVVTELKECLASELARKRINGDTESKDLIEMVAMNPSVELGPPAR